MKALHDISVVIGILIQRQIPGDGNQGVMTRDRTC